MREKLSDRVKTNRRNATLLARLPRAGELTVVWVPGADREAMYDLVRPPKVAQQLMTRARQHLQGLLLQLRRRGYGSGAAFGASRSAGRGCVTEWSLRLVVEALRAMRGVALISAVVLAAEVGDFNRFANPRLLMSYFGLIPGERSGGETVRRGGITRTSNTHARRALVESAWAYRIKPRISCHKIDRIEALPKAVRDTDGKHKCASAPAIVG